MLTHGVQKSVYIPVNGRERKSSDDKSGCKGSQDSDIIPRLSGFTPFARVSRLYPHTQKCPDSRKIGFEMASVIRPSECRTEAFPEESKVWGQASRASAESVDYSK